MGKTTRAIETLYLDREKLDLLKDLMPPRVELTREQHHSLQVLSEKTGKPVKELVRAALARYLKARERSNGRGPKRQRINSPAAGSAA
jgi:hypothetical protein